MTPEYLIDFYKKTLADIEAGPFKRTRDVTLYKSRIAKLEKRLALNKKFYNNQSVAEGSPDITAAIEGDDEMGYDVIGYVDGKPVGMATFVWDDDRQGWVSDATDVDPEFQRMGVATAMYDLAKKKIGQIIPSDDQTDDAEAFWGNKKVWEDSDFNEIVESRLADMKKAGYKIL